MTSRTYHSPPPSAGVRLFISEAVFFFLLSSICAHINIWSTIIAVSHIMDNAQLRVMKKRIIKKSLRWIKRIKRIKIFVIWENADA